MRQLDRQGAITALARELAWQAGVVEHGVSAGGQRWLLRLESATLSADGPREKLAAALAGLLGCPVQLELQTGAPEDTLARRDAAERARQQARAEDMIRGDPVVVQLMQQFNTARLVPGSIKPLSTSEGPTP